MENKITGIYIITNTTNGKIYIGNSKNIKKRWHRHWSELSKNRHHSIRLQKAYNRDGKDSFIYTIKETCTIENLIEREKYWVQEYKSMEPEFGYNIVLPGEYPKYKGQADLKKREKVILSKEQIEVIDLNTLQIIDKLPLLADVCKKYNLSTSKAGLVLKGKKCSTGGYILQRESEPKDLQQIIEKHRKHNKDQQVRSLATTIKTGPKTAEKAEYNRQYWLRIKKIRKDSKNK